MKILIILALLIGAAFCGALEKVKITHTVVFTVSIDGKVEGDIEIGLFGEVVPKTVENFR